MRPHDWTERLGAVLRGARPRAYDMGRFDCAILAADVAQALTGIDPGEGIRGRYTTYAGGLRLIRSKFGARSLQAWADAFFPRVAPAQARRGDWALAYVPVDAGGRLRPAILIIDGSELVGPEGARLPLSAAIAAWAVG